ncbi:MAG TPA: hypothetical protein VF145_13325 [Chitinophagaceae bacterium]
MKKLFVIAVAAVFTGCFSTREGIQANLIDAELIRIDTVQRYVNTYQQLLTWRTSDHMEYVSYVPMGRKYVVGTRMAVLTRN